MIISHKYKFIFIKTRKTAGSTIEYNLSSFLGPNDVITPLDGIPNANDHMGKNYILENNISKFFNFLNFSSFVVSCINGFSIFISLLNF